MTEQHHFCSHGILSLATEGHVNYVEDGAVVDTLTGVIREQFPDRVLAEDCNSQTITRFNDHPDTTFADVERVFEKAEVAWDERI